MPKPPRTRYSFDERIVVDQMNTGRMGALIHVEGLPYDAAEISELAILMTDIMETCRVHGIDPVALSRVLNLAAAVYDAHAMTEVMHNGEVSMDHLNRVGLGIDRD